MNRFNNPANMGEMLSAYIDGELSAKEIENIESKLALSKELQDKFEELKKIKRLTAASVKHPDDSPYFETKVLANLNDGKSNFGRLKNWIPATGFAVLAITLMILLKYNPDIFNQLVEEQKTNIAGFYKENLKPLLITAGITHEDIFNFAFNRQLPIDREKNQYLQLGSDPNGKEYFEIKTAGFVSGEDNFENFVNALDLNEKQKHQMDSILETYADEMQSQVLVNENNTVAINPNLWNYNKAIFADIMSFAEDANKEAFVKIIPAGYSLYEKPVVQNIVRRIKSNSDDDYIFLTPDTIFMESYNFDKKKFDEEMKKANENLKKEMKKLNKELKKVTIDINIDNSFGKLKKDSSRNKQFKVFIDTNFCRVDLSNINIPEFDLPDLENLEAQIEEATKHFESFSFSFPKEPGGKRKFHFKMDDSTNAYDFEFQMPDVDSIIKHSIPNLDSMLDFHQFNDGYKKNFNYNFKFNPDSLEEAFKFFMLDSLGFFDHKKFEKQMKEFGKEMEMLKKEMNELQREFKVDTLDIKKKKYIEI